MGGRIIALTLKADLGAFSSLCVPISDISEIDRFKKSRVFSFPVLNFFSTVFITFFNCLTGFCCIFVIKIQLVQPLVLREHRDPNVPIAASRLPGFFMEEKSIKQGQTMHFM